MFPLKQSTSITVPFFCHDVDGDAVTGLTDGGFTKRISKNGGAFAAMTVTIAEMENGWYSLTLTTTHSNTLGILTITLTNAGCKQVNLQFRVHGDLFDDLALDIADTPTLAELQSEINDVQTDISNLNDPTDAAIADKILGRSLAGGGDGGRTVRDALRALRNRVYISGGTLHVTQENDTTDAWTAAVTTTAGNPISDLDPT